MLQRCSLDPFPVQSYVIFDPVEMQSPNQNVLMKKIDDLLQNLVSRKIMLHNVADKTRAQYLESL